MRYQVRCWEGVLCGMQNFEKVYSADIRKYLSAYPYLRTSELSPVVISRAHDTGHRHAHAHWPLHSSLLKFNILAVQRINIPIEGVCLLTVNRNILSNSCKISCKQHKT